MLSQNAYLSDIQKSGWPSTTCIVKNLDKRPIFWKPPRGLPWA